MEITLKIVEDFQALSCLWDVTSEEYKNRNKRSDAMMKDLAKKYQMPHHETEKKIRNLKSQFRREREQISRENSQQHQFHPEIEFSSSTVF